MVRSGTSELDRQRLSMNSRHPHPFVRVEGRLAAMQRRRRHRGAVRPAGRVRGDAAQGRGDAAGAAVNFALDRGRFCENNVVLSDS